VQPVVAPGDDGVDTTLLDDRQQPLVCRPALAGVGRAIVVLEVLGDLPALIGARASQSTRWRSTPARWPSGSHEMRV